MDAVAAVLIASALVLGFATGALFGYNKGAVDGFKSGYVASRPKPPKRDKNGRFTKE